ncbi:quinone oxidoreductase [Bradyrhizobium sp. ARR65]|uniref:quinone oxidoreductase family protein n=1 Tax=Bradyrhizobium sp. ARR65 TaxID=1040989 RepID=UPI0004644EF0|nr:quinone oxidoreductase [Bradyrhizobium sp. ARR65]
MTITAHAFKFSRTGGPDVLEWVSDQLPAPAEGQVQIRHEAIGVNYIDVYHRSGTYPLPLPSGIGVEGAGTIEAVGSGVSGLSVGDRVAYAGGPPGAYATIRNAPAARVVKPPAAVSSKAAASLIFKGLTVEYLIRRCYQVKAGDVVLWHAAAGGIGLIACQWLKAMGATVIGTVGSEDKAKLVRANGCDHPIVYTNQNFVEQVKEITKGEGVAVVYDSVGAQTFNGSLDCLRMTGTLVSFGTSSGPVPPFDLGVLGAKGSLFVTRPSIAHYTAKRPDLEKGAAAVFEAIERGTIKAVGVTEYKLADAAQAHRDLEARKTSGSLILLP